MRQWLNQDWQFQYGECPGMELEASPTGFSPIGLPHTFQLPYYGEGSFYVGYGVYRKALVLTEEEAAGRVFLEFMGVFQEVELYVSGVPAGGHRGGYTAFSLDITSLVTAGENILFLRVNNRWRADLPPRAGEHTFCGGIYRDVVLRTVPRAHIRWQGVCVKTPEAGRDSARVRVSVETEGACGEALTLRLLHPSGAEEASTRITIQDNLAVWETTLPAPALWSPEEPSLYTLELCLAGESETVRFGVHSLRFSPEEGFFLNGEHYALEGVNVHQDHGGWGDAVTRSGITRDLTMMKEAGFNFVRGSHYPKHPFFAEECDRLGLLYWCEAPFWGIGGFQDEGFWNASAMPTDPALFPAFEENCRQAVREMVLAGRNHPSIFTWSMGNELFFSKPEVLPALRELLERLLAYTKQLDDTRPASVGGTQRGELHTLGDLTGFNGDGAVLFQHPALPSLVAEYGSVVSGRPGEYRTYYTDGVKEQPPWRSGRALWCGFHHGSIANIGKMGIVDLYRVPLRAYYAYREQLRGVAPPEFPKPGKAARMRLTADKGTFYTDGGEDCRILVELLDAQGKRVSAPATVTLEAIQGGGLFPTGNNWVMREEDGTFADGEGAIELRSYHAGEIVVRAACPGLPEETLRLTAKGLADGEGDAVCYPACPAATSLIVAEDIDLLLNRPVRVSSEREGHARHMANDGSAGTGWRPQPGDSAPYWQIDMENVYQLRHLRLSLGKARLRICLQVSDDGEVWQTFYQNRFRKRFHARNLRVKSGGKGRYLRLTADRPNICARRISAFV